MIAKIGLVARPVARHRVAIMHVHFTVSWQNKCPLFRVLNKPRVRNLCVTVAARALFVAQKTSRVHLGNRPVIDRASCEQRHCHRPDSTYIAATRLCLFAYSAGHVLRIYIFYVLDVMYFLSFLVTIISFISSEYSLLCGKAYMYHDTGHSGQSFVLFSALIKL